MSGRIPTHGPVDPPTGAPIVEIMSAGNEVLIGDVLDTNTNWLCTRVTALGGLVRRTVMLRDDVEAIGAELRGCLARRPALVFTVGGLGPTSDDRTLEGVALGLGVPLELHAEAERMVAARYRDFFAAGFVPFPELNESRRKMARLPAGAEPLVNPIGGAPGVLCRSAGAWIVSLPGVPGELKAIVDESLEPLISEVFGDAHYEERSLEVELQDESAIADVLHAAEQQHPAVYVKSRAKVLGSTRVITITLSGRGADGGSVAALLEPAAEQLLAQIGAAGFTVRPVPPDAPDHD
ncbi:MAG: competence/damage-inducible protein A [Actinobacteria bacterium]|nr:competence/damage-inducible protein A [Actinomycetota bacterium]